MKIEGCECLDGNCPQRWCWTPVAECMPVSGTTVLACYLNSAGMMRRIRACWVAAKTEQSDEDSEIGKYDEAEGCYFDPEGWYEKIDNWGDYSAVAVCEGEVTHWMSLPAPPPRPGTGPNVIVEPHLTANRS